jgi:hypothetical protein
VARSSQVPEARLAVAQVQEYGAVVSVQIVA